MTTEPDRPVTDPPPPNPYGAFAAVDGLGGTAAPLLAGFSITLMALVLELGETLRWPDLALILLGVAVVMFLQVVQLNARARGYAVTPAQVREWYADLDDSGRQAIVRLELRHHRACWSYLVRRTRLRYNLGILALLCAVMAALVPRGQIGGWRVVVIVVVAIGVGLELLEITDSELRRRRGRTAGGWLRRSVRWLAPADPPVPASFMDERPGAAPEDPAEVGRTLPPQWPVEEGPGSWSSSPPSQTPAYSQESRWTALGGTKQTGHRSSSS